MNQKNEGRSKLGKRMESAVAALLTEKNHEEAAAKAKISLSTLKRWLRMDEFAAALADARRQAFANAIALLETSTGEAIKTLRGELTGEKAGDRIRAAIALLESAFRGKELLSHEERIKELESILADLQKAEGNTDEQPSK